MSRVRSHQIRVSTSCSCTSPAIRGVQCRISDPIRSKKPDIRKFRIGEIAIWIRSELFGSDYRISGSDHRVFRSGTLKFLKIPDPYPIRKPEIFSGYPIRNIRNLKIGSDIRNFGSEDFQIGYFCTPLLAMNLQTIIDLPRICSILLSLPHINSFNSANFSSTKYYRNSRITLGFLFERIFSL